MPPTEERSRSVLIVEDDQVTRNALVLLLRHLGYVPVPVATVAESLALLDGQHYAIVDLELPDGLGTLVLERIRTENRPIRVAITTGTTDTATLEQARHLKPEILLRKPINVNVLLKWLEGAR